MLKYYRLLLPIIALVIFIPLVIYLASARESDREFSGQRAYEDVVYQVSLGPRTMGSEAHQLVSNWIISQLQDSHWQVETQKTVADGKAIENIIARRGTGAPWIIIASHFDSRSMADQDPNPDNRMKPVMGANDGASSVAILLELAWDLPSQLNKQIWLVFFDNEDNGSSSGTGWDIGSNYFVSKLQGKPDSVVVLDMVGDKDLNIYMEKNSDTILNTEIWNVANELGYSQFVSTYKYGLIDDHIPFIRAGIRAIDVIDFDYPYWHTTNDTLDNISPTSLQIVGDTILRWLETYPK